MITFPDEDPWLFQYLPAENVRGGSEPLMMDPAKSRERIIGHGEVSEVPIRLQISRSAQSSEGAS